MEKPVATANIRQAAPPETGAGQAQIYAGQFSRLYQRERSLRKQLENDYGLLRRNYVNTVKALIAAREAKDPFTEGHSQNVLRFSLAIAREMGIEDNYIDYLEIAAILHDIGKIGVPGEILNKPGKLNYIEYALVKTHVNLGAKIIEQAGLPKEIQLMVAQHHELYDGSGYPQGLRGEQIIQGARVLTVADIFEALTSNRPYRPALPFNQAAEELQKRSGSKFDPKVVGVFLKIIGNPGIAARTRPADPNLQKVHVDYVRL